ncbi:MAG: hypothetical protein PUC88_05005 [Clostridia bacterium]|nr:hypothetical protein [Clostridia bacterium]
MNNKNRLLTRILFNNKIVAIISLVSAFCIWVAMCMSTGEEITKKISNIPINIVLSQEAVDNGLKNFAQGSLTAEVTIKGNRLSVGSVTAENIEIVASQASSITSPGTYTLELSAKKIGMNTNYEFSSSVYPSTVIVTIDRMREVTFPVINDLKYSIAQGFYEGTTQYSSDEITVSGPETEVSRIDKAVVTGKIDDEINETKTVNQKIVLLDMYGDPIQSDKITISEEYVDVTIPVDYKKKLKTVVTLQYDSDNYEMEDSFIKVSPEEIEVAGPYDELKGIDSVNIGTINLAEISSSISKKTLELELPTGWKNLSNISVAVVDFDMEDYSSKTVELTSFDVSGCSKTSKANVTTKSLSVTITGKTSEIGTITKNDIVAYIDFGNKAEDYSGTAELKVKVIINDSRSHCWATGEYTATVDIISEGG